MKRLSLLLLAAVFVGCGGGGGDGDGDSGSPFVNFRISGQVTLDGIGLSGVSISGSGINTQSDASGNYTFTIIGGPGAVYHVTPSKTGFAFSPNYIRGSIEGSNITAVNFIATSAPYSISGQVTLDGVGLSGVSISTGFVPGQIPTLTDASGNYTLTSLLNGDYTITPTKEGFAFSPPRIQQTVSGASITAVNFIATPPGPFGISGQVTRNGIGISGVFMTLSGDKSAKTTTDASGNYTFTDLLNGNYIITPDKFGSTFSPASSQQTVSGANITVNFTVASGRSVEIVTCPPTGTTNVSVQDNVFIPQSVAISTNGIVMWIFNGPSPHVVMSGNPLTSDGKFFIGPEIGQRGCAQFYETGTYPYFCVVQLGTMTGSVVVQ